MVETKTQKSIIRQKGFQLAPEKHKHQNNTTETQDKPFRFFGNEAFITSVSVFMSLIFSCFHTLHCQKQHHCIWRLLQARPVPPWPARLFIYRVPVKSWNSEKTPFCWEMLPSFPSFLRNASWEKSLGKAWETERGFLSSQNGPLKRNKRKTQLDLISYESGFLIFPCQWLSLLSAKFSFLLFHLFSFRVSRTHQLRAVEKITDLLAFLGNRFLFLAGTQTNSRCQ